MIKSVLKILITFFIVLLMVITLSEFWNMQLNTLQLVTFSKVAVRQACILYSQETYKPRTRESDTVGDEEAVGGTMNMPDLVDKEGTFYLSGRFYPSDTPEGIYTTIHTSGAFRDWINNNPAVQKGKWESLRLINLGLTQGSAMSVPEITADTPPAQAEALMNAYGDSLIGAKYVETMVTPINMGIPYLDTETLTKMYRWNLAQIMSNCNPALIQTDDAGQQYVRFRGFRVYANQAAITNLDYQTFDLSLAADRLKFMQLTNLNPDNLGFERDNEFLGADTDERERICLVGVEYSVPVAYEGVTPVKRFFAWVWDNDEVGGFEGFTGNGTPPPSSPNYTWNDSASNLNSGGFKDATSVGEKPIPGSLIYYLVR